MNGLQPGVAVLREYPARAHYYHLICIVPLYTRLMECIRRDRSQKLIVINLSPVTNKKIFRKYQSQSEETPAFKNDMGGSGDFCSPKASYQSQRGRGSPINHRDRNPWELSSQGFLLVFFIKYYFISHLILSSSMTFLSLRYCFRFWVAIAIACN